MEILNDSAPYADTWPLHGDRSFADAVQAEINPLRVYGIVETHDEHECGGECDNPDLDFDCEGSDCVETHWRWSSADGAISQRLI